MITFDVEIYNSEGDPDKDCSVKFSATRENVETLVHAYHWYFNGEEFDTFIDGKRVETNEDGDILSPWGGEDENALVIYTGAGGGQDVFCRAIESAYEIFEDGES